MATIACMHVVSISNHQILGLNAKQQNTDIHSWLMVVEMSSFEGTVNDNTCIRKSTVKR